MTRKATRKSANLKRPKTELGLPDLGSQQDGGLEQPTLARNAARRVGKG